MPKLLKA